MLPALATMHLTQEKQMKSRLLMLLMLIGLSLNLPCVAADSTESGTTTEESGKPETADEEAEPDCD